MDTEHEIDLNMKNDIGMWPENMAEKIDYWVKMGSSTVQHIDDELLKRKSLPQHDKTFVRKCQVSFFERKNRNGELIKRSWLCFSPSNGRVYCFVCKLFSTSRTKLTHEGFCDWKNSASRLVDHETSKDHLNAVINFGRRSKVVGKIDTDLCKQAEELAKYWKDVLKRIISVIKFISERGLAFRGENEVLGSPNNGNYLGILELIAEYDEFLKNHIANTANRGRGHSNYLSSSICEEVIALMGKKVLSEIISRIKQSRYYSISLDSTPDEGHVDQLTLIFRYMEGDSPVERFVAFMPNQGHKARDMYEGLMNFLRENDIDLKNCRGQSYDNASAMSGKYNGLQALVAAENDLASWIPCAAHSLNLVVKSAAECCISAVSFFNFLEELYVFFTASTNRYSVLTECLKMAEQNENTGLRLLVPKRVDTTRWSCRADATKALVRGYNEIKNALHRLAEENYENAKARCDALGLYNKMTKLETGIFAVFWNDILDAVDRANRVLQNPVLDLNTAAATVKSLKNFIETKRECFSEYESQGALKSGVDEYITRRLHKLNVRLMPLNIDQAADAQVTLTPSEKFRTQSFIPVIDQFVVSLTQRLAAYELVSSRFGFLANLDDLNPKEIAKEAKNLVNVYKDDLDENLVNELIHFQLFCKEFKEKEGEESEDKVSQERWMYRLILQKQVKDSFPNVETALRIYLVLMITNCTSERSFSKLKLVKNRLRTTMNNDRLNYLTLMSLESDILREIGFDDIISAFVCQKSRKVPGML